MMLRIFAAVFAGFALVASASEQPPTRKELTRVSVDALTKEGQASAEPTDGFNMVWYIPVEFWRATLSQDKSLTAEAVAEVCDGLEPYFLLAVIRSDLSATGSFRFHNKKRVGDALTVELVGADGQVQSFKPVQELEPDVELLLSQLKPVLEAAMGNLGKNFHFFVYPNRNDDGTAKVSPFEQGTLRVTMSPLSKEQGGRVEFPMPFDSLFEPRKCSGCGKNQHVSWKFCPWDGASLEE